MGASMNSAWRGAGFAYRRRYHQTLVDSPSVPVLEIMPDHFFADPESLDAIAERYTLVFHDVASSVVTDGTSDFEVARLRRIRELVRQAKPIIFTDHLALTRAPNGLDLGHLAPVWYTKAALAQTVARVQQWQDVLQIPVALENITAPFIIPDADYTEAEFFHEVVRLTGCGILLDLTNLVINGRNFGFEPHERMLDYPLDAVVQVHLAGGLRHGAWWVDSHSTPVPEETYALLAALQGLAPLATAIVERDDALPAIEKLTAEASRAEEICTG